MTLLNHRVSTICIALILGLCAKSHAEIINPVLFVNIDMSGVMLPDDSELFGKVKRITWAVDDPENLKDVETTYDEEKRLLSITQVFREKTADAPQSIKVNFKYGHDLSLINARYEYPYQKRFEEQTVKLERLADNLIVVKKNGKPFNSTDVCKLQALDGKTFKSICLRIGENIHFVKQTYVDRQNAFHYGGFKTMYPIKDLQAATFFLKTFDIDVAQTMDNNVNNLQGILKILPNGREIHEQNKLKKKYDASGRLLFNEDPFGKIDMQYKDDYKGNWIERIESMTWFKKEYPDSKITIKRKIQYFD